jgi:hypothetical protein
MTIRQTANLPHCQQPLGVDNDKATDNPHRTPTAREGDPARQPGPFVAQQGTFPAECAEPVDQETDLALTSRELLIADTIAERVAERLRAESLRDDDLLDTAELARRFGVTAEWVRRNADRLGALRLGTGPRPRLRFDAQKVAEMLSARHDSRGSAPAKPPPSWRSQSPTASGAPLLPIRAPKERPKSGAEQL